MVRVVLLVALPTVTSCCSWPAAGSVSSVNVQGGGVHVRLNGTCIFSVVVTTNDSTTGGTSACTSVTFTVHLPDSSAVLAFHTSYEKASYWGERWGRGGRGGEGGAVGCVDELLERVAHVHAGGVDEGGAEAVHGGLVEEAEGGEGADADGEGGVDVGGEGEEQVLPGCGGGREADAGGRGEGGGGR